MTKHRDMSPLAENTLVQRERGVPGHANFAQGREGEEGWGEGGACMHRATVFDWTCRLCTSTTECIHHNCLQILQM